MIRKMTSRSAEETYAIGQRLGEKAVSGQIVALSGGLGAGKTVFTKGFADGLGVREPVTSPTFTILQVYESGRLPLYHFDIYRITELEEMDEIGYEEYFYGSGVTLVEWADLFPELQEGDVLKVSIKKNPAEGADYREITVEGA